MSWTGIRFLGAVFLAVLAVAPVMGADKTWNLGGSGSAANPNYWTPYGVPGTSDKAILPNIGQFYTVTTDATWQIDDLEIWRFATGHVNGYNLSVSGGGDIYGMLYVQNATFTPGSSLALKTSTSGNGTLQLANGTVAGSVNTSSSSQILGYGTINSDLSNNSGLIRAEGGQLSIELADDDHDAGTLGAAAGGTLYLRNAPSDKELWNKDQISLTGGTLKGSSANMMLKNYAAGDVISGYGRIQNFNVYVGEGTLTASGGQLQIDEHLYIQDYYSTVNVQSGATLHVPNYAWENNNNLYLNGGAITGASLTQDGELSVTGTGTIQNVTFNYARTHRVENNATLKITGQAYLSNATISMGGSAGYFRVEGSGASVRGRGVIDPDVTVAQGSLYADYSGGTLRLSRSLTVNASQAAYATGGATLQVDGSVSNSGNLYATGSGSVLTVAGAVSNTATVYAASGGTVNLNGNVQNSSLVHANGGTVNVAGTVKDGYSGEYRATSGALNVSGSIESGADNTFSAYAGGTVKFYSNLNTSVFSNAGPLDVLGGTITLSATGQTLTNAAGKLIAGHGYLLESGRNLANQGAIDAAGGTLEIRGTVLADAANAGDFSATAGTLRVAASLQSGSFNTFTANAGGTVRFLSDLNTSLFAGDGLRPRGGTITLEASGATLTNASGKTISGYGQLLESGRNLTNLGTVRADGGTLTVQGAITNSSDLTAVSGGTLALAGTLTNNGQVFTAGSGVVTVTDTAPTGGGTFTANTGGIIRFRDGFTNASLTTADAIQLAGGMVALAQAGSMTNQTGKTIRGHGTLLEFGQSLNNNGLLEAEGVLTVGGSVTNTGNTVRAASAGDHINLAGGLTNTGLVEIGPGAALSASTATVTGGVTGGGRISLDEATMTVSSALAFHMTGHVRDNERPSTVIVHGDIDNRSSAAADFQLAHSSLSIFNPFGLIGAPHRVAWQAEDRGADLSGLDLNMAIGKLTFGDGIGAPASDAFELIGETTIYCYGLRILEDAALNLGGRTIYYLRDGVEHNGIVGTGFLPEGSYDNGQIIEIVPEPATLALLALGALAAIARRTRR